MGTLEGAVIVVTGAGRGIGRAIAEELGHEGARVVVNYAKSKEAASDLVARLQHSKRSESLLRCKLGDLAELLKGEVMAKDCPCCQEVAGRRRKSGQATLDHLTHIRGKHAVRMKASMFSLARWLCCVCMREFANDLVGVLRREGTQFQARER